PCAADESFRWRVPRVRCQQGWEGQVDGRRTDDLKWAAAKELRAAGEPPHQEFEARGIPFLTREPVAPVAIKSIEVVRPADYSFALNPREFINAMDKSANHIVARMLLATFIHSDRAQKIDLRLPHTRPFLPWKLNGKELK